MAGPLVIVESPTKAKKITEFLSGDASLGARPTVIASVGHIRDLPGKAKQLPEQYQKAPWAYLAIDVDNGFEPHYIVPDAKKSVVTELRRAMKDADSLYLATDEDREGEAIAWHLLQVLKPPKGMPVHRMVFHEITAPAIREAFANPRELNDRLVDAQETRRLLDLLYGYDVSQVAWKKVNPGLSAGRVQSVATRLVVEREREIMAFVPAGWWDLEGTFAASAPDADRTAFTARMVALDGTRLATGGDFSQQGELTRADRVVLDEATATGLAAELGTADFAVRSVDAKPYRKRPFAPFITSTLQQVAGRALNVSAKQVMSMAQSLYQQGYITYMRTDSTNLSSAAVDAARAEATERYGAGSVPSAPRSYGKKVANAQEAHEAIRPSGDRFRRPEDVRGELQPGEARLYELIWRRTVASQMNDAVGETVTVRLGAQTASGRDAEFSAAGTVITERGWMQVEEWRSDDDEERRLPALSPGDALDASMPEASRRAAMPPSLPPATRRPAWSPSSRSSASVARRPTRRSWRPSRTGATSGRRVRPSCRAGPPSPSPTCSSSTSPSWSTTASRATSKRCSTASPPATPTGCRPSRTSTSGPPTTANPARAACATWSPTGCPRSTPPPSTAS